MSIMTRLSVVLILFLLAILGLAQAASDPPPKQQAGVAHTTDEDAEPMSAQSGPPTPREADIAFAQATKERGLEGWMSFFADDAYVGTNPDVKGKLELRRFYARLFSRRDLVFEWAPEQSQVFPSGLMGYTSGRYKMSYTTFEGKTASQTGSYVTIWQKQPDKSWKVLSDFGSQDRPDAPAKPASKPDAKKE
jgi:ketosteroid isomerase-like protein